MRARAAPPPEMPMADVRGVVAFLLEDFGKGNFLGREAFFLPETGQLRLDRNLIVISPNIGGAENAACFSYPR